MIQDIIAWICIATVVIISVAYAIRYLYTGSGNTGVKNTDYNKDDSED